MSPPADLVNRVLALPDDQLADLVHQIIRKINDAEPKEDQATVDRLWSEEIDARIAQADADPSSEIDSREAIARAREAVRREQRP